MIRRNAENIGAPMLDPVVCGRSVLSVPSIRAARESGPVEPQEEHLLLGVAGPATHDPARWLRIENPYPPYPLAPPDLLQERVVG